jgi:hypothetical protein
MVIGAIQLVLQHQHLEASNSLTLQNKTPIEEISVGVFYVKNVKTFMLRNVDAYVPLLQTL